METLEDEYGTTLTVHEYMAAEEGRPLETGLELSVTDADGYQTSFYMPAEVVHELISQLEELSE